MRETTEEEFIRYVRDNGVSAALQPALILLYRLPIKPNNLKEFFAEYLENGACTLTNISLLRAELCYLQSEERNLQLHLRNLDRDLENMSKMVNKTVEKKAEETVPENPDGNHIPDLMTRFVEDTKKNPSNNYNPFDLATPDFQAEEMLSEEEGEGEEETKMNLSKSLECLEEKNSVFDMIDDLKDFDPWGMIFKYNDNDLKYDVPKRKAECGIKDGASKGAMLADIKQGLNKEGTNDKVDNSIMGESNDSEDADTLVELFHAKIIPDDKNEALILKQKTEKVNFSNLMGWRNDQRKECNFSFKYPLYTTLQSRSNIPGKEDSKGQKESKDRNLKNVVKFYSQMNSNAPDGNLLDFLDRKWPMYEDTYSRGIQTDILREFEDLDGESWEWEWVSDDYCLLPENSTDDNNNKTAFSERMVTESKKGYSSKENDSNANEVEILQYDPADTKPKQNGPELLQIVTQRVNDGSAPKIPSPPDTLSQQCTSSLQTQSDNSKKGRFAYTDKQDFGVKLLDKTDNKRQVGTYTYTKPNTGLQKSPYAKQNTFSQASNRKTAKLLKYINDTYDVDTASKLQQQFDFRIFDDCI